MFRRGLNSRRLPFVAWFPAGWLAVLAMSGISYLGWARERDVWLRLCWSTPSTRPCRCTQRCVRGTRWSCRCFNPPTSRPLRCFLTFSSALQFLLALLVARSSASTWRIDGGATRLLVMFIAACHHLRLFNPRLTVASFNDAYQRMRLVADQNFLDEVMLLPACCRLGSDRVRQRVSSACFNIYEFSPASPPRPCAGVAQPSTASSPMPFAGLQDARKNIGRGDVNLDMYSCIVVPGRFRQEACYLRPVSARVCTDLVMLLAACCRLVLTEFDNVFLQLCSRTGTDFRRRSNCKC